MLPVSVSDIKQDIDQDEHSKNFVLVNNNQESKIIFVDENFQKSLGEIQVSNKKIANMDIVNHNLFYNIGNHFYRYDLISGKKSKEYEYTKNQELMKMFRYNGQYYGYDEQAQKLINSDDETIKIKGVVDMYHLNDNLYILKKDKITKLNLKTKKETDIRKITKTYKKIALVDNKIYLLGSNDKIIHFVLTKEVPISIKNEDYSDMYVVNGKLYAKLKNSNGIEIYK